MRPPAHVDVRGPIMFIRQGPLDGRQGYDYPSCGRDLDAAGRAECAAVAGAGAAARATTARSARHRAVRTVSARFQAAPAYRWRVGLGPEACRGGKTSGYCTSNQSPDAAARCVAGAPLALRALPCSGDAPADGPRPPAAGTARRGCQGRHEQRCQCFTGLNRADTRGNRRAAVSPPARASLCSVPRTDATADAAPPPLSPRLPPPPACPAPQT